MLMVVGFVGGIEFVFEGIYQDGVDFIVLVLVVCWCGIYGGVLWVCCGLIGLVYLECVLVEGEGIFQLDMCLFWWYEVSMIYVDVVVFEGYWMIFGVDVYFLFDVIV